VTFVAWIDCETTDVVEAGDHWLVPGRVTSMGARGWVGALVFVRGAYGQLATSGPERERRLVTPNRRDPNS
jgi:flavin reductase (DIM6/NTAB) family NADH-FMN oxidoreductase RutF